MASEERTSISPNHLKAWNKLQINAEVLYDKFPQLNCAIGTRKDVEDFTKFCSFYGRVLDVGCGPRIPSYLQNNQAIEIAVGIDPLVNAGKENTDGKIHLLRSIGEFLPFQDNSFDFVCFATSFDHVIDPINVLRETRRIIKKNGIAVFWISDDPSKWRNLAKRTFRKIKRLLRKEQKRDSSLQDQESIICSMEIPPDAVDQFHLRHVHFTEFNKMCESLNFKRIKKKRLSDIHSVFVKYKIEQAKISTGESK